MFELREYQEQALQAVFDEWENVQKTLLVLVTGAGKTIIFSKVVESLVREGKRVLVLAHRGELLEQAADKLQKSTGLMCATEKAEETCIGSWYRVVVGSIQSLMRPKRLEKFPKDFFDAIVVDEAHHCLSSGYQTVLNYFDQAKVLGVTATPDRGDKKNLGQYFESIAYEYTLPQAIKEGYLVPIKAMTIPINIDLTGVRTQSGDFATADVGNALTPYLVEIAKEMAEHCRGRKTVVFTPLIATSKKLVALLKAQGLRAAEVNGESLNRAETLQRFDEGGIDVLCNSMLLTEGWDCPVVDCIVVLRATKSRSLFVQMVGRGTRLCEGKDHLLLLDFLWMTQKLDLVRPAHLIAGDEKTAKKMTEQMAENPNVEMELEEVKEDVESDAVREREESLAKQLEEMRKRKRTLVDPLQYEMSIQDVDLANYEPAFGWEILPMTDKQKQMLEKHGIFTDEIECAGKAKLIADKIIKRKQAGLTTPRQIRFLEKRGFLHVGSWSFEDARKLTDRIAANGWRIPRGIVPKEYTPEISQEKSIFE